MQTVTAAGAPICQSTHIFYLFIYLYYLYGYFWLMSLKSWLMCFETASNCSILPSTPYDHWNIVGKMNKISLYFDEIEKNHLVMGYENQSKLIRRWQINNSL